MASEWECMPPGSKASTGSHPRHCGADRPAEARSQVIKTPSRGPCQVAGDFAQGLPPDTLMEHQLLVADLIET